MIYQNPNDCMGNRSTFEKFTVALGILKNSWMLLLDKAGLVKNPVYVSKSGVKFQTRGGTTDINDAVVVLSGKEYPHELLGIDTLVNSGVVPTILDCGGHIGCFTMYVKSHYPNTKIFTMEPVPDNLKLLNVNIGLNKLKNVKVIPFALYGNSGRFYIDLSGKQFDAVSVTTEKPSHENFVTIDALTLDEVLLQNQISKVYLLKMDIEGAEYNIFQHSLESLCKNVKRIIMEFHPAGDTEKRNEIVNRLCTDGTFKLIYETKNILGFENDKLS